MTSSPESAVATGKHGGSHTVTGTMSYLPKRRKQHKETATVCLDQWHWERCDYFEAIFEENGFVRKLPTCLGQ